MLGSKSWLWVSAQAPSGITAVWPDASLLIAQPQTVHSLSGASGVGTLHRGVC